MSQHTPDQQTLWDLIKDIEFGMLTHRHRDGTLQGHPLTTQNQSIDEGSLLYFFISEHSDMATLLRDDSHVNLAYSDPGADTYVSIAGSARISGDQATRERLWSRMNNAWFPGGVNDPDLALLEVSITHAKYWNVRESKVTQLFAMARAAMTGERPKHLAEHKELHMT